MSEYHIKKVLPNLKITLPSVEVDINCNIEDGEILEGYESDNLDSIDVSESAKAEDPKITERAVNVQVGREWMTTLNQPREYKNRSGGFVTGIDLSSEALLEKLEERKQRFGLEDMDKLQVTKKEIDNLYKSLEIYDMIHDGSKAKNIRLDTIHMRGVDQMHTKDIFNYFKDYGASTIEWINDMSCNVVWMDETTAARAMLGMSSPMPFTNSEKKISKDKEDDKDSDMECDVVEDTEKVEISVPIPPGIWRLGVPHPKTKSLLLRFATKKDQKLPGAEKRSAFYQKFGNPNYGGLKGLISKSKKHKLQQAKNKLSVKSIAENKTSSESELAEYKSKSFTKSSRQKMPRMTMYADEEEKKTQRQKMQWRHKAQGRLRSNQTRSIHDRLGTKYTREDLAGLGSYISDEESSVDSEEGSKLESITCKLPARFNVWGDIAHNMSRNEKLPDSSHYNRELSPSKELQLYKNMKEMSGHVSNERPYRKRSRDSRNRNLPLSFDTRRLKSLVGKDSSHFSNEDTSSSDSSTSEEYADLRSKVKKLKKEQSIGKHRSPLCREEH